MADHPAQAIDRAIDRRRSALERDGREGGNILRIERAQLVKAIGWFYEAVDAVEAARPDDLDLAQADLAAALGHLHEASDPERWRL